MSSKTPQTPETPASAVVTDEQLSKINAAGGSVSPAHIVAVVANLGAIGLHKPTEPAKPPVNVTAGP